MAKFTVTKDFLTNVRRFHLKGRKIEFKIKMVPADKSPVKWFKSAISDIVDFVKEEFLPTDKMGISFSCGKFTEKGPGWMNFRNVSNVNIDDVWEIISSLFQSNSEGFSADTFCMTVTTVRLPIGTGKGRRNKYNNFEEECLKRRGIWTIKNIDSLCLVRAVAVALAFVKKDPNFNEIRKDTRKSQLKAAQKLLVDSKIVIPEKGGEIEEIRQFQTYLKDCKITVYEYDTKGRKVIFKGGDNNRKYKINLLHHNGHFNPIRSLTAAFAASYFCDLCDVPYNTKNRHRCQANCSSCQQSPPCNKEENILCSDCNRYFKNKTCFNNHKQIGSFGKDSVCKEIYRCNICLKISRSKEHHVCGEVYCKICQAYKQEDHQCFMRVDTGNPKTDSTLFVFFDFETMQEEITPGGEKIHEANLCVLKQFCNFCIEKPDTTLCEKCGIKTNIIRNNPVENFVQFVLSQRQLFQQVVCIAHNGQGFDFQLILNYMLGKTTLKPELIMRGTKIILLSYQNLKFIDSLNYFPMPLKKFQVTFDLPEELKKGYFPHLFNTKDNQNYVGTMPDVKYYDPDSMMSKDRDIFLRWYEENKNAIFDMRKEITEYCISDVNILAQACLKFRNLILKICNVCPFTESCTIAGTCNKIFRRNYLQPDTLGIIPRNGYRFRDNQSEIAMKWLIWEQHKREIEIFHAGSGKEIKLNGVRADGFCPKNNEVFFFQGCFYHGCINCYPVNRDVSIYNSSNETFNTRYESTVMTVKRLEQFGYKINETWECDFRRQLLENKEIETFTRNHPMLFSTPLNPRDAFYGGRTGNTKTYKKCKVGEKILYFDVCSLYPYICKCGKFPVGHPEIYVGNDCLKVDLNETDGLIKCEILPPEYLYHPVLPTKMNNKLLFVLCRTCGETQNIGECNHVENDRILKGTWVIAEVREAVKQGYKLKTTQEIWKYQTVQYDPEKKEDGLFSEMMNNFLKMKQEASGWPSDCHTEEEKKHYVHHFYEKEGIHLDANKISKNAGFRSIAKLILNSFWGKLGQKENQPKTVIIREPYELFQLMTNNSILINHILPINENTIVVNYEFREETYDIQKNVNVVYAAFTTALARLKLYGYLEKLKDKVLYYDTDSVIFVSDENEKLSALKTGNFIGDLTDELVCFGEDSFITEFASGGPKNYAYKVLTPSTGKINVVCKVKGIRLNYDISKFVNIDIMKDMILNEASEPVKVSFDSIQRTPAHEVVTKRQEKNYRLNSTKRKFLDDHDSLPYGFKRRKLDLTTSSN